MRTDVRERGKNGGGEWRPLSACEERPVQRISRGVSVAEIAREYEVAKYLLMIAEAVGDEKKAEMQRERIKTLEDELKDAVSDEDYEDF